MKILLAVLLFTALCCAQSPIVADNEAVPERADALVGRCPAMQEVYKAIGRVAGQNVTVLIFGESGTGKELVARAIYQHGARAGQPFLAINCGAIPEPLLESDPRMVFCAAVDRNGYLPVHNRKYSLPQRPGQTAWNTANSRARRIFDDRAGFRDGVAVIADDRRFAERMDRAQLLWRPHVGLALITHDLVRQPKFFQEPQHALRA